jgi:predicted regulator of Ras-like GTPase activity (Roadblock/LC7/MglB family)
MVKKKRSFPEVAAATEQVAVEEAVPVNDLRSSLDEIKSYEGIIGYILKNSTSVAIDLKDPTKIIDYAVISSSVLDASVELSELFDLGEIKDVVVEGKSVKALCLAVGENRISVFMEKNADREKILRKLHVV